MMHDPRRSPDKPDLADEMLTLAMFVRMVMADHSAPTLVLDRLKFLQHADGRQVTNMFFTSAGAIIDPAAWAVLPTEHLEGARDFKKRRVLDHAGSLSGEGD